MEKYSGINKFSKEYLPEERSKLAKDISEKRTEYFSNKKNFGAEINKNQSEKNNKLEESTALHQELNAKEQTLKGFKENIVSRLINFFNIKKVEEEIGHLQTSKDKIENDIIELEKITSDIAQAEIQNQEILESNKKILEKSHSSWAEKKEFYQTEAQVEKVSKENDVLFVHGIKSGLTGTNSLLYEKSSINWKTKLDILLGLEPTISTSAIDNKATTKKIWSPYGVLLKGGEIEAAFSEDAGTIAKSLTERKSHISGKENLPEKINNVIKTISPDTYNEFVINNPKIAGFYYSLDPNPRPVAEIPSIEEIQKEIAKYNLPLYLIKNGKASDLSGNPISYQEIVENDFKLDQTNKNMIIKEISEDCPFRIETDDIKYIDAYSSGEQMYLDLFTKNIDLSKDKSIATFYSIRKKIEYSIKDGELLRNTTNTKEGSINNKNLREGYDFDIDSLKRGWIKVLSDGYVEIKKPITNSREYIKEMRRYINELKQEKINSRDQEKFRKFMLNAIAYNLYGFAKQAENKQDIEIAKEAKKLASELLNEEKVNETIAKRLGPNGELKINIKELS